MSKRTLAAELRALQKAVRKIVQQLGEAKDENRRLEEALQAKTLEVAAVSDSSSGGDTSGSMAGATVVALRERLERLEQELSDLGAS